MMHENCISAVALLRYILASVVRAAVSFWACIGVARLWAEETMVHTTTENVGR